LSVKQALASKDKVFSRCPQCDINFSLDGWNGKDRSACLGCQSREVRHKRFKAMKKYIEAVSEIECQRENAEGCRCFTCAARSLLIKLWPEQEKPIETNNNKDIINSVNFSGPFSSSHEEFFKTYQHKSETEQTTENVTQG